MRIGLDILLLIDSEVIEVIPAERLPYEYLQGHFESGGTCIIERTNLNDNLQRFHVEQERGINSLERLLKCIENY